MRLLRSAVIVLAAAAVLGGAGVADAQFVCGGLLQPRCPPPPPPVAPPPAAPVAVTLTLTPEAVTRRLSSSSQPIAFRGTVTGLGDLVGVFVELHQTIPGYGPESHLAPQVTQVRPDGTFAFEVNPRIGLDVQVVVRAGQPASGASPVRHVTVRSRQHLSLRAVSPTRGRFVFSTTGPGVIALESGDVAARAGPGRVGYLYVVSKDGRSARRISSGRVRRGTCSTPCRSAIGLFRITPEIVRAKHFLACARGPMYLAIEDDAVSRTCGERTVRLR